MSESDQRERPESPPPSASPSPPAASPPRARLIRLEGGLLIEAVLIVLSILLAFAIEAWWSEAGEGRQEVELLQGLQADFRVNRDRLAQSRAVHESHRAAALTFLEVSRPGGTPDPGALPDDVLIQMVSWHTYDPVVGTVNSAIASGQLGLIERDELRSELALWLDLVEDLNEEELADRVHTDAFQRAAFEFVSFRSVTHRLGLPGILRESTAADDYAGLLGSLELENWATARVAEIGYVLDEIDLVEASLDRVLTLLAEELGEG